jgi:hypothetical protein
MTRHIDWDFVLFPLRDGKLTNETKRAICWHVPDERLFRLPVALGEGHGFTWFSYSTIPHQNAIRAQLMLSGGDDPLQLALRGLSVVDEGGMTRNSVSSLFVRFGDKGFAALDDAARMSADPTDAIRAMGYFPDGKATARLVELYNSADETAHQAAARALLYPSYRQEAKQAYFDMIRRQLCVDHAMTACAENDWKDALPAIEGVIERPSSLATYRDAYLAYRQLSGNPIDARLLAARLTIANQGALDPAAPQTAEQLAAAHRAVLESPDVDGAVFVAFCLATYTNKADVGPVKQAGIELLRALPRPLVAQLADRNWDSLEASDRPTALDEFR